MKIRFERGGVLLEYELKPMKEGCFRALCALAGVVVAALCGLPGLVIVGEEHHPWRSNALYGPSTGE